MENLITRLQLRTTIQDYITQLMIQNDISATQMEDALNHILLIIKDAALNDYAVYSEQHYNKDKMDAMENLVQSYTAEGKEPQIIDNQYVKTSEPIEVEVAEED